MKQTQGDSKLELVKRLILRLPLAFTARNCEKVIYLQFAKTESFSQKIVFLC